MPAICGFVIFVEVSDIAPAAAGEVTAELVAEADEIIEGDPLAVSRPPSCPLPVDGVIVGSTVEVVELVDVSTFVVIVSVACAGTTAPLRPLQIK